MATRWKTNHEKRTGSIWGILLVLLCAIMAGTAMLAFYPHLKKEAKTEIEEKLEKIREQNKETCQLGEETINGIISSIYYMNYAVTKDMGVEEYVTQGYDTSKFTAEEKRLLKSASESFIKDLGESYGSFLSNYRLSACALGESEYGSPAELLLLAKGEDKEETAKKNFAAGLIITFDEKGLPSVADGWNLRYKDKQEVLQKIRQISMREMFDGLSFYDDSELSYEETELLCRLPFPQIKNATFVFAWDEIASDSETYWQSYQVEREAYLFHGYLIGMLGIAAVMILLALILQNIHPLGLRDNSLFLLPTELTGMVIFLGILVTIYVIPDGFAVATLGTGLKEVLVDVGVGSRYVSAANQSIIWLSWVIYAFFWYWAAASVLPYITHPIRSLKERMLFARLGKWILGKTRKVYAWATEVSLTDKQNKTILKIIFVNGIVVALLCCLWFGGIFGAILYSVILYILIKRKSAKIMDDYQKLLARIRRLAKGDFSDRKPEDMGLFNPVRDELAFVQEGFKQAVESEVRSQNMKTELITNVSHDLKTPLTAIITYVDLLKQENLSDEERQEYVNTLDKKSQRLKVLIEDLFEVSKAATNNVVMNYTKVDLVSLIKEVRLENEDKIAASGLDIRWNLPEEKCVLSLDPNRTYRIIDNLLQNILKYSMEHSRVYIDMTKDNNRITVCFKNISAEEMNFSAREITERFVRGDRSRNSEGSGLGMAIAQSFTELQKGSFRVETDGDLFKVTISWKTEKEEKIEPLEEDTE